LNAGGATLEGVKYTYPVNNADGTKEKESFDKRYAEAFPGRIPTATSYFMYDGIMLLDKAFDVCAWNDGPCIENFLKNYGTYNGLSGEMQIQKDGKNIRPFGIKTVENGEFVWVTKEVSIER
jgi:ABC-type branched-subunit amino acid transport system substrate-binding protein